MTEFRPGRFQILPAVIKNLIIINVLIYLAEITPLGESIIKNFALFTWQSPLFRPWQLITHLFLHSPDGIWHIFFNMYALWFFGSVLENLWGPKRFLTFYIVSGLGAALCHMTVLYYSNQHLINDFYASLGTDSPMSIETVGRTLNEPTLGASGAVFGCLAAFGYLFPNAELMVFPIFIPIKAKWFVIIYAGLELVTAIQSSAGDNVAHVAHLGGALAGFLMVYYWNKSNKKTF